MQDSPSILLLAALLRLLTVLSLDTIEAYKAISLRCLLFWLGTALETRTDSPVCQRNGTLLKICLGDGLDTATSAEVVSLEVTHFVQLNVYVSRFYRSRVCCGKSVDSAAVVLE